MVRITIPAHLSWKLQSRTFIHISAAGTAETPELPIAVELAVSDDSQAPIRAELISLIRFPLNRVPEFFSWLSHNKDPMGLIDELAEKDPGIASDKPMMVCLYRRMEL